MAFALITDSAADLPREYYEKHDVRLTHIHFSIGGETYDDGGMSYHDFYQHLRNGAMPTTSMIAPQQYIDLFEPILDSGKDILYIAFSSGLSGSYESAVMAAQEMNSRFPYRKILVVDSLAASLGQGLLVDYAVALTEAGKSMEQVHAWVEENKLKINHVFTVQDLMHLHRGGRVSKTSALMGTLIGIKPVLYVNPTGHLIPVEKKRGRRNALEALVDRMEQWAGRREFPAIAISHSDCEEDALAVEKMVRARFSVDRVIINPIGPVIGSHTGIGTVALFFLGNPRT